ncbi:thaumatin-like protein [Mrakia frigida]|uniref:thaumatin family protein n=1 Tax=Mrakia frigida TaxID=29902 RepID=UPI003FCBEFFA
MLNALPTLSLLAAALSSSLVEARQMTVKNNCAYTKWPAMFTGTGEAPNAPTGWEAAAGSTVSFNVPETWTSGRIWGRTGCDFSDANNLDASTCVSGGCPGGLECTAWGQLPTTLAEFGLGQWQGVDFYDLSLVDGYNLPVSITPSDDACKAPSCAAELNAPCPADLQSSFDDAGSNLGCKSACTAVGGDKNCCTGAFNNPTSCVAAGVTDYAYFKTSCPNAYAFAFDETSGTALWGCNTQPSYTVEFCPST